MFSDFMRVWEAAQPAPSESDEPQAAHHAQLDRLREAMESGPGGDVDANGRVTRAGLSYVPGLKRTVSEWQRMREHYERGELGGEGDGQGSRSPARRQTSKPTSIRSVRYVRPRVRSSKRPAQVGPPARHAYSHRNPERSTWDDVLDGDLKYLILTWIDTVLWEFALLGALAILACAAFDAAAVAWLIGFVAVVSIAAVIVTVMIFRARAPHDTEWTATRSEEASA